MKTYQAQFLSGSLWLPSSMNPSKDGFDSKAAAALAISQRLASQEEDYPWRIVGIQQVNGSQYTPDSEEENESKPVIWQRGEGRTETGHQTFAVTDTQKLGQSGELQGIDTHAEIAKAEAQGLDKYEVFS